MPWRRTALPVVQLAGNELVHPPQPVCDEGCEAVLACAPLCGTRRQTCRQRKALPTVACAVHRATCVVKHATGAACKLQLSLMGAAVSTGRNYWARPRHICTRTGSCCSAEPTLSLTLSAQYRPRLRPPALACPRRCLAGAACLPLCLRAHAAVPLALSSSACVRRRLGAFRRVRNRLCAQIPPSAIAQNAGARAAANCPRGPHAGARTWCTGAVPPAGAGGRRYCE